MFIRLENSMKVNKRLLMESIFISILIVIIFQVVKVIQGVINTKKIVPDIIDSYTSTNYIQHEVTFGAVYVNKHNWIMIALGMVILIVFYYGIRVMINKWNRRRYN